MTGQEKVAEYTISQYADYAAHVWDKKGRHYDLLKQDDVIEAGWCSDAFVRALAKVYGPEECCCFWCVFLDRKHHKTSELLRRWRMLCELFTK